MGERGPAKKPTALKAVQNQRIRSIKARGEVAPEPVETLTPALKISDRSQKIFDEISAKLSRLGLLTEIDAQAFVRYCDLFDKWLRYRELLDTRGDMITYYDENGNEQSKVNPALAPYINLHDKLLKLEREFGMTPSARASIPAKTEKKEKTINDVLYGDEDG